MTGIQLRECTVSSSSSKRWSLVWAGYKEELAFLKTRQIKLEMHIPRSNLYHFYIYMHQNYLERSIQGSVENVQYHFCITLIFWDIRTSWKCPASPLSSRSNTGFVFCGFLLLEAAFTFLLHAAFAAATGAYIAHLALWPRESVIYKPLCSHLSLNKAVRGNLELSPEELETIAAIRRVRLAENTCNWFLPPMSGLRLISRTNTI